MDRLNLIFAVMIVMLIASGMYLMTLYKYEKQKSDLLCEINNNYAELINSDLIPQIEKDNNIKLSKIVRLNCDTMKLELKGSSD